MALTINTNLSSLITQRNLDKATNMLNQSIERMTTGYKISKAADNAANFSIAKNLDVKISSLDVAADNAAVGSDLLTTMEDTYSLLAGHLQRVRDLTEQAANGTYGVDSLKSIQSEAAARVNEIIRIASNAEFNGLHLMTGAEASLSSGMSLQVGLDSSEYSRITLESTLFSNATISGLITNSTTTLGAKSLVALLTAANGGVAVGDGNYNKEVGVRAFAAACAGLQYKDSAFSKGGDARDMLAYLDSMIADISNRTTKIGAAGNRIDSAVESISVSSQNLTSTLSTIRDADVAEESSQYIKAQILQQAAATLLSTANQLPSLALNLL